MMSEMVSEMVIEMMPEMVSEMVIEMMPEMVIEIIHSTVTYWNALKLNYYSLYFPKKANFIEKSQNLLENHKILTS